MNTRIKTGAISLASVAVLAALTGCGPSQEEQDKTAVTEVATQFVLASSFDKCKYEADYTDQIAIEGCQSVRSSSMQKVANSQVLEVQATEPWGAGYAVKLKGLDFTVVGLVKIGDSWKVSKDDTTSEAVAAQSDWACQVIGGPDCGGSK